MISNIKREALNWITCALNNPGCTYAVGYNIVEMAKEITNTLQLEHFHFEQGILYQPKEPKYQYLYEVPGGYQLTDKYYESLEEAKNNLFSRVLGKALWTKKDGL